MQQIKDALKMETAENTSEREKKENEFVKDSSRISLTQLIEISF